MLENARAFLTEHRPALLLALHGQDQVERCYRILGEIGYFVS